MKLIVLDRDGTLNQEPPEIMIRSPEEWVPLPGALEAVARLYQAGWRIVIAANNSGIDRGTYGMATLNAINARIHKLMADEGVRIEAIFFCPHLPEEGCDCRKPEPGLFQQIARRFGTPVSHIVAVGDSVFDAQAAAAAGCEPHLVLTGQSAFHNANHLPEGLPQGTRVHADLMAFADFIVARDSGEEK